MSEPTDFARRVYEAVCRIPEGRVATYGQIATLVSEPRAARAVGQVLSGLKHRGDGSELAERVPWQRVINAAGRISAPNDAHRYAIQRALLEAEGVEFDEHDKCDLRRFRWVPEEWD